MFLRGLMGALSSRALANRVERRVGAGIYDIKIV